MKFPTIILSCAILASTMVCAHAQGRSFGSSSSSSLPERLQPFDANGDGRLDREERAAYRQARREARRAARESMLERHDANGDGVLDEGERDAARDEFTRRLEEQRVARFLETDVNASGGIDIDELRAVPSISRFERLGPERFERILQSVFRTFDRDGSGEIELDEFNAILA